MRAKLCDVCGVHLAVDRELQHPVAIEQFAQIMSSFPSFAPQPVSFIVQMRIKPCSMDVCSQCETTAIIKACEDIISLESKVDPLEVTTEYQNGSIKDFYPDSHEDPSGTTPDPDEFKELEPLVERLLAPGSCGCPKDFGDAVECMNLQRVRRPALLFKLCKCECHGSGERDSASREGCSGE